MKPMRRQSAKVSPGGFALLALLILLAIIGIATSATVTLGVLIQRRFAEEELLEIGSDFQIALRSYASATPAGQPMYPITMQDLLKDPRTPGIRRHLRKLYGDPMSGQNAWGLIPASAGIGFVGIHSLSDRPPIKIDHFDAEFVGFEHRSSYTQWEFRLAADAR